jgi:hypothetical protein
MPSKSTIESPSVTGFGHAGLTSEGHELLHALRDMLGPAWRWQNVQVSLQRMMGYEFMGDEWERWWNAPREDEYVDMGSV